MSAFYINGEHNSIDRSLLKTSLLIMLNMTKASSWKPVIIVLEVACRQEWVRFNCSEVKADCSGSKGSVLAPVSSGI